MRMRAAGGFTELADMPPLELNGPISEPLPCPKRRFETELEARNAPRPPQARPLYAYRCKMPRVASHRETTATMKGIPWMKQRRPGRTFRTPHLRIAKSTDQDAIASEL